MNYCVDAILGLLRLIIISPVIVVTLRSRFGLIRCYEVYVVPLTEVKVPSRLIVDYIGVSGKLDEALEFS